MKVLFLKLFKGDCYQILDKIPDGTCDFLLTDPPYCSGGLNLTQRKAKPSIKYGDKKYSGLRDLPDFTGDNMDMMSFVDFQRNILWKCRQKLKPGSIAAVFIDWRNLGGMISALQQAGYLYNGILVWNKKNSRALPDRFRNDCEFAVWGTNGAMKTEYKKGCKVYPNCFTFPAISSKKRVHQTEKPVPMLTEILRACPEGGRVLDPFMGSGSTGEAALRLGLDFVGIELSEEYFTLAKNRLLSVKNEAQNLFENPKKFPINPLTTSKKCGTI